MIKILIPQRGVTVELGPLTLQRFPSVIDAVFQLIRENIPRVSAELCISPKAAAPKVQVAELNSASKEIINAQELGLVELDGRIMVGSRDIAKSFRKQHSNVLDAIKRLDCSDEFAALNFKLGSYKDKNGQSRPEYFLTRDGFTFLVMGFTGQLSARFKEAYIRAFNAMEAALTKTATKNS